MMRVVFPLRCADGTTFSVQASDLHYCQPRDNAGPWTTFETGTPVREEDVHVSGHVTEVEVWAYINKHGGLDLSDLLLRRKEVY